MISAFRLAFADSVATAFSPRGAEGRWNSRGTVVVYTAEHPALAVLEIMTAWNDYQDFSGYHLYRCEFDAAMVEDLVERVVRGSVDPTDRATTRAFGDLWTMERRSVALRVPSVVAPHSHNYLLNPAHPDFEDAVARQGLGPLRFDPRLVELVI